MNTCKFCQFWTHPKPDYLNGPIIGTCDFVGRVTPGQEFRIDASAADDTDLQADLRTGPDFGCVCFKRRTYYKVEVRTTSGWDDAGWELNGKPSRFRTVSEAIWEIHCFVKQYNKAVGHSYTEQDFRVVPAAEENLSEPTP